MSILERGHVVERILIWILADTDITDLPPYYKQLVPTLVTCTNESELQIQNTICRHYLVLQFKQNNTLF